MKVGLITIHSAENIGAALQAYATQQYLSKFAQVEIIDYYHNNRVWYKKNQKGILLRQIDRFKKILHPIQTVLMRKRATAFRNFRKQYLNLSKCTYYGDTEILNNPPVYDIYICGSDQLWNAAITRNSESYFLSFTNSKHKYSFASSVGHANMTKEEKELAKKYLPSFAEIAVREQGTAKELSELLKRPIQTVLDPVFLLSKQEWEALAKSIKLPENGYIVVYALQENEALHRALKYAQTLALPIVFMGKEVSGYGGIKIKSAGPQEFLYILANAKYVITNSFHGFAFSLIFQKQIFICEHTTRNLRLENLLELIGFKNKQVKANTENISLCQIDGEPAYSKLDIQYSRDYLANIFKEEQK